MEADTDHSAGGRGSAVEPRAVDVGTLHVRGVNVEDSPDLPAWYRRLPPWMQRWAPPLTLAGLSASLVLHIAFLVLAAVWLIGGGGGGGGGNSTGGSGVVGVAVMTEAELGELVGSATEPAGVLTPEPLATEAPIEPAQELRAETLDLGGIGDLDATLDPSESGSGGSGQGEITSEDGLGIGTGGGAGSGTASFFGLEARGVRFAYICDISGSMLGGVGGDAQTTRADVLKAELERSLKALSPRSFFAVVLFSGGAAPLGQRRDWIGATDDSKRQASRLIRAIVPDGDTQPMPAFHLVLQLRPRPDAIYFMTDGEFPPEVAEEIARQAVEYRIPIHCITLISEAGEPQMRRIAQLTGGTYTHVTGGSP